ncbi:hypothetical protein ES332_A02G151800v1 [Gossypium tomentosum]|uniref:Uncharacterized protein n=1 Tax=Gossypium tomentosum TaxID=34277 RepID=A0A5D2RHL3_GOSTO|nr:hypothetical protein ES332_A02G151800v1 [Gossypium tomentosum]
MVEQAIEQIMAFCCRGAYFGFLFRCLGFSGG